MAIPLVMDIGDRMSPTVVDAPERTVRFLKAGKSYRNPGRYAAQVDVRRLEVVCGTVGKAMVRLSLMTLCASADRSSELEI